MSIIKLKFQGNPLYGMITPKNVDRQTDHLYRVVTMLANVEAIGHGIMTDHKTLQMMAVLGNAEPGGIKSRFGHPGWSENAMGKKVGNSFNFRIDGDRLLSDIRMLPAARHSPAFFQDPLEYIYQMAETNPEEIGMSVVIDTDLVWITPDGVEHPALDDYGYIDEESRPPMATTELPIMRPVNFWYNDFVSEGALTHNGLFSTKTSSGYAEQAFEILDQWRQQFDIPLSQIPQKADNLIKFYLKARSNERSNDMAARKKLDENTELTDLDQAILNATESDETEIVEETPAESEPASTLDEAVETAENTAEELKEDAPALAEMAKRIQAYENQLQALQAKLAKMEQLVLILTSNDQVLTRRVKRLETEPITTAGVPTVPSPSAKLARQNPQSVTERQKAGSTVGSNVMDSINRAVERRQKHGAVK